MKSTFPQIQKLRIGLMHDTVCWSISLTKPHIQTANLWGFIIHELPKKQRNWKEYWHEVLWSCMKCGRNYMQTRLGGEIDQQTISCIRSIWVRSLPSRVGCLPSISAPWDPPLHFFILGRIWKVDQILLIKLKSNLKLFSW